MNTYRTWVLLLTLWFALLQTVAPLMHAHAAGDTAADDGPHMHMVDIPALHTQAEASKHPFHWHVHSNKSHGQIIGLGQAISESNPLSSLIDAYASFWLPAAILPALLLLAIALQRSEKPFERHRQERAPSSLTLACHAPRAPPYA
ncbi:hypothetical protein Q9292_06180 [Methylophilus sp. VKM B-3414]|uniref:hypothetical protein n=1 Tax=Methylophilus sp. VKM B-3414 TaxID=3076121 RepID=UPI0028C69CAE|nr:hypothetical protein [Methylophilus sp. VKM B-3414]MDT7849192.1 hypothetical protein [Methylophilus sp. VKM B-3414]